MGRLFGPVPLVAGYEWKVKPWKVHMVIIKVCDFRLVAGYEWKVKP